jgi:hypothetical protein
LLEKLHALRSRREFLQLFGKGLGYSALATILPACGNSSSSGDEPDAPVPTPSPPPKPALPAAYPEYTALKRLSFGPYRDELAAIKNIGINSYIEQQMDHLNISDGTLEADIRALFPLTFQTPVQLLAGFPDNIFDVPTQMIAATQYRQMFSKRPLYERNA